MTAVGALLPTGHRPLSSRHLPLTSAAFQPLGHGYLPATSRISNAESVSSHSPSPLIDADQNHSPTGADALAGGTA